MESFMRRSEDPRIGKDLCGSKGRQSGRERPRSKDMGRTWHGHLARGSEEPPDMSMTPIGNTKQRAYFSANLGTGNCHPGGTTKNCLLPDSASETWEVQ